MMRPTKRLPPSRRAALARRLEALESKVLKIEQVVDGTADAQEAESAEDWLVTARGALQEAGRALLEDLE